MYFRAKFIQMKKISILSIILLTACISFVKAQNYSKCASHQAMNKAEQLNPGYMQSSFNMFNEFYNTHNNRAISDTFLYVRVVVHVVYNTTAENLHDSVIYNQINVLNEDYGRMNEDTINLRSVFAPIAGVDSRIRFLLADTDPQGNPTTGITRTQTSKTTFFNLVGGGLAEDVKDNATGGISPWDQNRYLNIWVCNMSIPFLGPAVLGYAVPPSGLPNWDPNATNGIKDGVVIQYQVFGGNNPNTISAGNTTYISKGRTTVHEVGHYLGLRHIWGDATNCAGDDGIDDTPAAADKSNTDCDTSKNTCVDNIAGIDMPDMVENYMDYSAEDCQNSFTKDQVEFMRWVIRSKRPDIATVSFSGLNTKDNKLGMKILPNPANDVLVIEFDNHAQNANINVFNISGQLVTSINCQTNRQVLNIASWPNGVYFIELTSANQTGRSKLIINH